MKRDAKVVGKGEGRLVKLKKEIERSTQPIMFRSRYR
jgi:hypothetical protein